jgi:phosphatidylglycerol:prolipoprotein diacylglycerol transferase
LFCFPARIPATAAGPRNLFATGKPVAVIARVPLLAYWTHNLSPFLVRFSDNVGIRYYGLAYLLGFVGAWWLLRTYHRHGRSPFDGHAIADLMTYVILGVLVGGRLGYFLLYQTAAVTADPFVVFRVWEGGMASHGGFIGVTIAMAWWSRQQKVSLFRVSDLISTVTPLGLMLGRIANFINGELPGKPASVPWAVIFPGNELDRGLASALPRHPSQLYQAALEGGLLLAWMQWRFWRTSAALRPAQLAGEFLLGYAGLRMIGEVFREPDASLLFGLSRGSFYSIFLLAAGAGLIVWSRRAQPPAGTGA